MHENINNPGGDQNGSSGTEPENDRLDIGNHLSAGNQTGSPISDFDPENDSPETEEKEYRDENDGDDERSDDNGINPSARQVNPQAKEWSHAIHIENADEDQMNPYPDELRPNDDDDKKHNSTWMSSGRSESN